MNIPTRSSCRAWSNGFSLLELLVVITIAGILISLIVPFTGAVSSRRIRDSADEIALVISQARSESILSASVWQLLVDPVANTIQFQQLQADGQFMQINARPFSHYTEAGFADIRALTVNGIAVKEAAGILIYPTGEQDSFEFILSSDAEDVRLSAGATGNTIVSSL